LRSEFQFGEISSTGSFAVTVGHALLLFTILTISRNDGADKRARAISARI